MVGFRVSQGRVIQGRVSQGCNTHGQKPDFGYIGCEYCLIQEKPPSEIRLLDLADSTKDV